MRLYGKHPFRVLGQLLAKQLSSEFLNKNPVLKETWAETYLRNLQRIECTTKVWEDIGQNWHYKTKPQFKTRHELDKKISDGSHQGIVVDFKKGFQLPNLTPKSEPIEAWLELLPENRPIIVLDRIQDPHNTGAILRTAEALGFGGAIVPVHDAAPLTGSVHSAATGASLFFPIKVETNLSRAAEKMTRASFALIAADAQGDPVNELQHPGFPCALLVGAEGTGLKRVLREKCDIVAAIPMLGECESLNASVSAGILMHWCMSGS